MEECEIHLLVTRTAVLPDRIATPKAQKAQKSYRSRVINELIWEPSVNNRGTNANMQCRLKAWGLLERLLNGSGSLGHCWPVFAPGGRLPR